MQGQQGGGTSNVSRIHPLPLVADSIGDVGQRVLAGILVHTSFLSRLHLAVLLGNIIRSLSIRLRGKSFIRASALAEGDNSTLHSQVFVSIPLKSEAKT